MQGKRTAVIRIDKDGNETRYSTISDAARSNYTDRSVIISACRTGAEKFGYRYRREDTDVRRFSTRLYDLRTAAGLTINELAEKAGITKDFARKLEAEDRTPSAGVLSALAYALGVTMDELWRGA